MSHIAYLLLPDKNDLKQILEENRLFLSMAAQKTSPENCKLYKVWLPANHSLKD